MIFYINAFLFDFLLFDFNKNDDEKSINYRELERKNNNKSII